MTEVCNFGGSYFAERNSCRLFRRNYRFDIGNDHGAASEKFDNQRKEYRKLQLFLEIKPYHTKLALLQSDQIYLLRVVFPPHNKIYHSCDLDGRSFEAKRPKNVLVVLSSSPSK